MENTVHFCNLMEKLLTLILPKSLFEQSWTTLETVVCLHLTACAALLKGFLWTIAQHPLCSFSVLSSLTEARGLDHIAENILSYLDAKSLCAAELVCKEWYRVTSDGMLWKKLIERMVRTDSLWRGLAERRGWWALTLSLPAAFRGLAAGHDEVSGASKATAHHL